MRGFHLSGRYGVTDFIQVTQELRGIGAGLGKGKGTVHSREQNIPPARGPPLKKAERIVAYGIKQKLKTQKVF